MNRTNKNSEDWQILLLESDEFSSEIKEFIQKYYKFSSAKINRSSYKKKVIRRIRDIARKNNIDKNKKTLTLMSSGDFHHFTYGLCRVFADPKSRNYCYMHFDAHADDAGKEKYLINCANFVNQLLRDSNAEFAYFIGTPTHAFYRAKTAGDSMVCSWKAMVSQIPPRRLLASLDDVSDDVYISLDLDFLQDEFIITNYNNKDFPLDKLLKCLKIIKKEKNVIGADILGYANKTFKKDCVVSRQEIDNYNIDREKSLNTYKILIDYMMEK